MEFINPGHNVLVLWGMPTPAERLQSVVDDAKKIVGDSGQVAVENIERLAIGKFYRIVWSLFILFLYLLWLSTFVLVKICVLLN